MTVAVATVFYTALFLFSFLASRKVIARRGAKGAVGLGACWLALAALFAYAPSLAPFVPLNQSLSFAIIQMVLIGSALGFPAGLYNRWKQRTKQPPTSS